MSSNNNSNPSENYPMPEGWKKAVSDAHGGKPYFINTKTKETSWIDPRDALWKKKTWAECGPNEIPFGWEVIEDPVIGRYFIDHINKVNCLDDPRDNKPKEQIQEVKKHIQKTKDAINFKKNTLRLKKDEIAKIKQQVNAKDLSVFAVEEEAKELESQIAKESQTVDAMNTVVQTLETDKDDQLARQQQIQQEINEVKVKLAAQSELRSGIQQQLTDLKESHLQSKDKAALKEVAQKAQEVTNADKAAVSAKSHAKQSEKGVFGMELNHVVPMTRVERELELLQLKRQLEIETEETARLKDIAQKAKAEIDKALTMSEGGSSNGKTPEWVKLLNEHAKNSGTVRANVKSKQAAAVQQGQVMSFRDKLLFFSASPLSE